MTFSLCCLSAGFSDAADKVTIGALVNLSRADSYSQPARLGIEIAVKQINAKGGIKGKKIDIFLEDSEGSPETAVSGFQKLAGKATVIIGPVMSSEVLAVAPVAQRSKIVLITPTATSPGISESGEYVYRGCTSSQKQAEILARYAKDTLKTTRVAMLYSNEPYGIGSKKEFTKRFFSLGLPVTVYESFIPGDKDFTAQLMMIQESKFDLLFIPGYLEETASAAAQALTMGITVATMGVDGDMSPEYIKLAGKAAEGHISISDYDEAYATPLNKAFKAAYYTAAGTSADEPGNIMVAALAYDMTRMAAEAIAQKGNAPDAIRSYLDTVKNFDGVTGRLSFDSNGDIVKQAIGVFKVTNGSYVKVQ